MPQTPNAYIEEPEKLVNDQEEKNKKSEQNDMNCEAFEAPMSTVTRVVDDKEKRIEEEEKTNIR